jgi:hypothetical protein
VIFFEKISIRTIRELSLRKPSSPKTEFTPTQKSAGNSNFAAGKIFQKKSRGKATGFFYKGQRLKSS